MTTSHESANRILTTMLDRIFAAIVGGPALNCRPHASRQRVDLVTFSRLASLAPGRILGAILSEQAGVKVDAAVPAPPRRAGSLHAGATETEAMDDEPPEVRAARRAFGEQQSLLSKLRILADEARTYEQDTGVHALYVGYPLLSVPPGDGGGGRGGGARFGSRRILAPLAFVPIELSVRTGAGPGVEIACRGDEVDRVLPNEGLLAWIERQTGREPAGLFADENGEDPWGEIRSIAAHVASALQLAPPTFLTGPPAADPVVEPAPRAEDAGAPAIIPGAVVGLFPLSRQGLLRDTKAMIAQAPPAGPVTRFLQASAVEPARNLDRAEAAPDEPAPLPPSQRRLVTSADPCQARAVALARQCEALVIHGPPGTGKSQTITNIIADHLARGERVLFVCDKRTALDVVANRLEHLGLGALCAVVHDSQRDQRDLYRGVREQLEGLADAKPPAASPRRLAEADDELARVHAELRRFADALMHTTGPEEDSLHDLVGRWLETSLEAAAASPAPPVVDPAAVKGCTRQTIESSTIDLQSILRHAESSGFCTNPWTPAAGLDLGAFLKTPTESIRASLTSVLDLADRADGARHPTIPPLVPGIPLPEQQSARARLAAAMHSTLSRADAATRRRWAARDGAAVAQGIQRLVEIHPHVEALGAGTLDPELLLVARAAPPAPPQLAAAIAALDAYAAIARKWHGFIHIGRRAAARRVLGSLGLPLSPEAGARARMFLGAVRAALVVRATLEQFGTPPPPDPWAMAELAAAVEAHRSVFNALHFVHQSPALRPCLDRVRATLVADSPPGTPADDPLLDGLARSAALADALESLETAASGGPILNPTWLASASARWRQGESARAAVLPLVDRLTTLESVLRVREGVAKLPASLGPAIRAIVQHPVHPTGAMLGLRLGVLAAEVGACLAADPVAATVDPKRVDSLFDRWRELEARKQGLVRDGALSHWLERQRTRLLVSTGSRLNSAGAELRRRVASRGAHALRLRQVLELGRSAEGGDPLLDLRPVWMASPETVAQVFPREPVFDIVVFDEASQCRLEEALPVLLRARRVVIAGDTRQLPPTRFFESAVADSDTDDVATDQDLFETQQSQTEDLLAAALNLDLHQAYLDVHYRSRNADLIAFSNDHFYGSRLQPIPGHPKNRTRYAPVTLYRAGGVYDDRVNPAEADAVVRIIRDLLRRAEPPSIGVGCFNIAQRDLIVERLDEAAGADPAFGAALAAARARRGSGSFEGLFVKNLENVQGDERDHIIISTTYGPDPQGRFYRRFGPLAMPGGGRRLNVLVTRARAEVHLVTSIPPEVHRSLPRPDPGQSPGGGWLLFAYLNYAERLAALYEQAHQRDEGPGGGNGGVPAGDPAAEGAADRDDPDGVAATGAQPQVRERPVRNPSALAGALGRSLAGRTGLGATIHWGNDGFCIDVALDHPTRPEDVTIGVLTDFARFDLAADAVEWDVFRTGVLESQGWVLRRLWSPLVFRDLPGVAQDVAAAAAVEATTPAGGPLDAPE